MTHPTLIEIITNPHGFVGCWTAHVAVGDTRYYVAIMRTYEANPPRVWKLCKLKTTFAAAAADNDPQAHGLIGRQMARRSERRLAIERLVAFEIRKLDEVAKAKVERRRPSERAVYTVAEEAAAWAMRKKLAEALNVEIYRVAPGVWGLRAHGGWSWDFTVDPSGSGDEPVRYRFDRSATTSHDEGSPVLWLEWHIVRTERERLAARAERDAAEPTP